MILDCYSPFTQIKSLLRNNSFLSIFGGSFAVTFGLVVKLSLGSIVQSRISSLEFSISVLERAESLREEQNLKK